VKISIPVVWAAADFNVISGKGIFLDELQFIAELRNGNETAFRQLVEQYQAMIYNTALGMLQSATDAEDITQEVFIQVHRSISSFKGDSKLATWLYRITVTKTLEQLRRQKRKKRFAIIGSLFGTREEALPAIFDHPGVLLENKERAKMLFWATRQLPDNQRVAFILNKTEGLGYKEVSEIMQVSTATVESLLYRAKQNLKKTLEAYYRQ
jgi:RNA polymerase sigma-70 factor (ECF subfamily)